MKDFDQWFAESAEQVREEAKKPPWKAVFNIRNHEWESPCCVCGGTMSTTFKPTTPFMHGRCVRKYLEAHKHHGPSEN